MADCQNVIVRQQSLILPEKTGQDVGSGLPRLVPIQVDVVSVTFRPEQLNIVDIAAKRRFLEEKGIVDGEAQRRLTGFFANPLGGRAHEVLEMPDFVSACAVATGPYFGSETVGGAEKSFTEPFVFFKPTTDSGRVIAPPKMDYGSGGFLAFPVSGAAELIKLRDFQWGAASGHVCDGDVCRTLQDYRLIVQSKPVLVSYDSVAKAAVNDGGLRLPETRSRTALTANVDGAASIVASTTPLTADAFADTLLTLGGVKYAINLDGGPSTQMAVRTDSGVETLAGYENDVLPSRIPSLFVVTD